MASYTFGREAFVAAEAEVHLCFVAEAECGPKPHFERHSAPEPKPNFGRSLLYTLLQRLDGGRDVSDACVLHQLSVIGVQMVT